ncbi:MAG: hypothetical protein IPK24_23620 [Kineosporiaceae bacterium]|nr:hypothetical protein [Kineosporiaceae bacterium]
MSKRMVRDHVVPSALVFAVAAAITVISLVVFSLVALVDDELEPGAAVVGLVSALAVSAGLALATFVLGLALDRLTRAAPRPVRWAAPAVLPVVGLMLFLSNPDGVGFYLLVLGAALCGYWVVFLVQQGIAGWVRRRWGTGRDVPLPSGPPQG